MRLRPSGRQGAVATSIESFRAYQRDEAWTWEHLALTRARVVAGPEGLAKDYEAARVDVLGFDRDPAKVIADVIEMRNRIADAKQSGGARWTPNWVKATCRMLSWLPQTAALLSSDTPREPDRQIAQGVAIGWFSDAQGRDMAQSHDLMWRLQAASKLLSDGPLDLDTLGQGGQDLLLRETGAESEAALIKDLEEKARAAAPSH